MSKRAHNDRVITPPNGQAAPSSSTSPVTPPSSAPAPPSASAPTPPSPQPTGRLFDAFDGAGLELLPARSGGDRDLPGQLPDAGRGGFPAALAAALPGRRAVLLGGLGGAAFILAACTPSPGAASSGTGGGAASTESTGAPGAGPDAASSGNAAGPGTPAGPGNTTTPGSAGGSATGPASAEATETLATTAKQPLSVLGKQVSGKLYLPTTTGYSTARLVENPRYDAARPLAVLQPKNAKDVSTALAFAADNGVPLALRAGGHSYPGYSAGGAPGTGVKPSLVIDSRSLNSISFSGTTVTVGSGVALAQLYAALAARGRALPGGSCATVGITGLTLGGGVGVMTRAHGLTADSLTSARVVTADGRVRTVDARHEPELFWALRGGGGGHLGVVTRLSFSTVAAPTVKSFYLQWPSASAKSVLQAWQAWAPTADRRLWSTLKILAGSSHPSGPTLLVAGTWLGPGDPPLAGLLGHTPKPSIHTTRSRSFGAAMAGYAGCATIPAAQCHTGAGGKLSREAFAATSHVAYTALGSAGISALLARVGAARNSGLIEAGISIDALGGKVSDVAAGATAFVHRKALATVQYTATYRGNGAAKAQAFVSATRAAMTPFWGQHAYVNYADGSIKNPAAAYFGANAPRLARASKSYDPHGLFTQPQGY